ncbi:unnamed protein product, partial [Allacma fusca]
METLYVTSDQCIVCTQPVSLLSEEMIALNPSNSQSNVTSTGPTADDVLPILFQQWLVPSEEKVILGHKSSQYCTSCYQRNEEILGVLRQLKALNACLEALQNSVENDLRNSFSHFSAEPILVPAESLPELDRKNSIRLGIFKKLNLIQVQEPFKIGDSHEDDPSWYHVTNEVIVEHSSSSSNRGSEKPLSAPCQSEKEELEMDTASDDIFEDGSSNDIKVKLLNSSPPAGKNQMEIHTADAIVLVERLPKALLEHLPININSLASHGITIPRNKTRRRKFNGPRFVCRVPKCP